MFKYFSIFSKFEKLLLFVIFLLAGYSVSITVPTVIDRSLSFYILEKIQQRGGGIKFDSFEYIFTTEFIKEHKLVDVRITEQLESGTVVLEGGCVKLTNKGNNIASFSRFFRMNLLPKKSKTPIQGGSDRRLKQFAITLSSRLPNITIGKTPTGNAGKHLHYKYASVA
jgi:hypothetical protein